MARAVSARAAATKPTEKKPAKVNGTGTSKITKKPAPKPNLTRAAPARGRAKKTEDAPATNGVSEEPEPAAKRKPSASQPKILHTHQAPAAGRGRAKKTATPAPEAPAAPAKSAKRKKDESDAEDEPEPEAKKAKVAEPKAPAKAEKPAKAAKVAAGPQPKGPRRTRGKKTEINAIRYTEPLKVFVFGEGGQGELGFGATKKAIDVKRPRYNEALSNQNVVKVVCGGMHVLALTKDNKILSWGVNDNGALGRDIAQEDVVLRDADADSDSEDEDETGGLNNSEATPTAISMEHFPEDTVFVDIAAGDSCSFALTTEGAIYGWGTFRKNEGILGFTRDISTAKYPTYVDGVTKVTQIVCGTNHIFALTKDKQVWAWGNGQQNQLGRRVTERTLHESLTPTRLGFHDTGYGRPTQKIARIASGDYHGFAIAEDGHIWAWGVNNYCETGNPHMAGAEDANVLSPKIVASLEGKNVESIAAGSHHNIAILKDGQVLVWGRCDGSQTGLTTEYLDSIKEEERLMRNNGRPKILIEPTPLPDLKNVVQGACGPDHTMVVDKNGKAYSWGFSANYQTGQGTDDDIDTPTMIDNTAVRETKLTWAGCGGQYSILASKK